MQCREDQPLEGEAQADVPPRYMPFLRLLIEETPGSDAAPSEAMQAELLEATAEIVEIILDEVRIPGFWKPARIADQERLRGRLFEELLQRKLMGVNEADATAVKLLELARARHDQLLQP